MFSKINYELKQICLMRQLNDCPKSQTAKTSSEQVPYRSACVQAQSSFAALFSFPKSPTFSEPYTSERLMYCGALGTAQRQADKQGVPVEL